MNLCVKAEPAALLSMTITDIEGNLYHIEEVADSMQADEFTFEIVPHEMEMLPFIQKGIEEAHPEFKQEVIKPKDEDHFFMANTVEYEAERHIVCKMPEVDNNRYDVLKESVKTLYDQCMTEIEKVKAKYTQILADKTSELPKKEADEAKEKLEALGKQYSDTCKLYYDDKMKEIEESHQKWLASQAEERLSNLQSFKRN
jgi:hypothetical protein